MKSGGRIARELHDTLEQDLAGISLQLDTASVQLPDAPAAAQQLLDVARSLLQQVAARPAARSWTCGRRSWKAATWPRHCGSGGAGRRRTTGRRGGRRQGAAAPLAGQIETNLLRIARRRSPTP